MASKRFKDPIYGYVEIEESIITQVVDTAEFQRLRDIIQTSYSPLYSLALHNRFVHSIGVHHLGKMAAEAFRESIIEKSSAIPGGIINQYIEIFELACLLHDVGHAPFSHTGEQFYLYKGERALLHNQLIELCMDAELRAEKSKGERFFFIFYDRKTTDATISIAQLIDSLLTLATNLSVGNRLM